MTTLFSRLALIASILGLLGTAAHATADGPDAWRVQGVAPHDVLNVRVGPGTDYIAIDALPYDARAIQIVVCTPTVTQQQYFALNPYQQQQINAYTAWCLVN